jgi:hypothetical protein
VARRSPGFYLQRARRAAVLVAGLLVAAVSVRFSVAALEHALAVTRANFEQPRPRGEARPGAAVAEGAKGTERRPARSAEAAPAGAPSGAQLGPSVRIALAVSAGPPRSELYVSGRRLGNTPFVGDMACKVGQPLKVEVVPPEGPPLVYERICAPGILRIDGSAE